MANEENLLKGNPDTQFSSGREAVENGAKGGKQKEENIKLRKSFSTLGKAMVDSLIKPELFVEMKNEFPGLEVEEITNRALMLKAQILKAFMGDSKAFEVVRDTIGEKPVDKQDIAHSGTVVADYSVSPVTQAAALKAKEEREKIDE